MYIVYAYKQCVAKRMPFQKPKTFNSKTYFQWSLKSENKIVEYLQMVYKPVKTSSELIKLKL